MVHVADKRPRRVIPGGVTGMTAAVVILSFSSAAAPRIVTERFTAALECESC